MYLNYLNDQKRWRTNFLGRGASNVATVSHSTSFRVVFREFMLPLYPIVGHIAENCSSEQRLCYNCRQPGHESSACPSPRTVTSKQCYSCGGVGHIQAECPSLRVQGGNQKCYVRHSIWLSNLFLLTELPCAVKQNCGRFGHIARVCPGGAGMAGGFGGGMGFRAPPPGRGLNTSALPPVKCYRCGGPNHMARCVFPVSRLTFSVTLSPHPLHPTQSVIPS